jgi:hypothetical protein
MICKKCPRWQGSRYSEWGDCNHVIGKLLKLSTYEHNLSVYYKATLPFDPHDCKYYEPRLHQDMMKVKLPEGVRRDVIRKDDVVFDDFGGERVGKVKVVLIQTHKDYDCGGAHD